MKETTYIEVERLERRRRVTLTVLCTAVIMAALYTAYLIGYSRANTDAIESERALDARIQKMGAEAEKRAERMTNAELLNARMCYSGESERAFNIR